MSVHCSFAVKQIYDSVGYRHHPPLVVQIYDSVGYSHRPPLVGLVHGVGFIPPQFNLYFSILSITEDNIPSLPIIPPVHVIDLLCI